jgi:hypothetical protein
MLGEVTTAQRSEDTIVRFGRQNDALEDFALAG